MNENTFNPADNANLALPNPMVTHAPLTATPTTQPTSRLETAPKRRKPALILASIAFALASLTFLILGPGVLIAALLTKPFSWIISFYYIYLVVGAAVVSIVVALLYFAAIISASRSTTQYLANIIIMSSSSIVGFATMWLSGYRIIHLPTLVMAILMLIYIVLPGIALILLHRHRKNQPSLNNVLHRSKKTAAIFITIILALVAEVATAGYYLFNLWRNYIPIIEEQNRYQSEQQEQANAAKGDKPISHDLASMAFALCRGGYDIVHQIKGASERAVFQCQRNKGIYEIYNPSERTEYYKSGQAAYYGTNHEEELEKYFPGQIYLYKNLLISTSPESIILLVEADSLGQVIDENVDAIYNYLQEATKEYKRNFTFDLLYNENLDNVKTLKDYIVLAAALRDIDVSWLPNGNGYQTANGDYIIFDSLKSANTLMDLARRPGSYSNRVREAIKYRKHLSFEVENAAFLTKEQLRILMQNSVVCEGPSGDWVKCSLEQIGGLN